MPYCPDPLARRRAILHLPAYLPGYPKEISAKAKAIHGLLSAEMTVNDSMSTSNPVPKVICNVSFTSFSQYHKPLDIVSCATPERYRLLDCVAAVSNRTLRILEFADFPCIQYAALSYVWRGNRPINDCHRLSIQEFSVLGAEDADPIGLDVLLDACTASLACGASYLWLDRLCIMQTSKRDKRWQIREMYRLYTFATICIVIPGGLRFLVSFSEETQWIHRAWTLQEVVAPPSAAVLFAWSHGAGETYVRIQGESAYGRIEVVNPRSSAMMGLDSVLDVCTVGHFRFTPDCVDEATSPLLMEAALFGKLATDAHQGARTDIDDIRLPNLAALGFATANYLDTDEMRDFCIWQCAFVRTSSRPVDMVFSIMGLFGVILDPSEFAEDDRLGATIALAREILRQGRSASWLGLSVTLPPCPYLSTFPVFPQTSVAGQPMYDLPSGQQIVTLAEAVYPNDIGLFPTLKGSMEETGYHSFDALAVIVVSSNAATNFSTDLLYDDTVRPTQLRAADGSTWIIHPGVALSDGSSREGSVTSREPRSFAVMIGFFNIMPAVTTGNNIRAMLVTEHAKNRYHVRSYFLLSYEALQWASTWKEYHFCVGGPMTRIPNPKAIVIEEAETPSTEKNLDEQSEDSALFATKGEGRRELQIK